MNQAKTMHDEASIQNANPAFRNIVDECVRRKLNHRIFNSTKSHAAYLMLNLLQLAAKHKHRIRIISGKLDRAVYNQLDDALEKCIQAEAPIDVLVLEEIDGAASDENIFYRKLSAYDKAQVHRPNSVETKTPHMLIVGDESFRLETDTDTHKAEANFNNPAAVEVLAGYFDKLFTESAPHKVAA